MHGVRVGEKLKCQNVYERLITTQQKRKETLKFKSFEIYI